MPRLSTANQRRLTIDAAVTALVAVALVQLWILAQSSFLPFVDLPQHVALAQLSAHRGDPGVSGMFEFSFFPQVNILYLLIGTPLAKALPEAFAVRVVLALYIAGLAAALWALTRALGTSRWAAVAGLLCTVNHNLAYGFLSLCLGTPILLWLLARWATDDVPAPPRPGALVIDSILWALLALGHVLLVAFALIAVTLRTLLVGGAWRYRLLRLLPILPTGLFVLAWRAQSQQTLERLLAGQPDSSATGAGLAVMWDGFGAKLADLGKNSMVLGTDGVLGWIVLGGAALGTVSLLLGARSSQSGVKRGTSAGARTTATGRSRRWLRIVALVAFLLYFALPLGIFDRRLFAYGLFDLYPRFLILAPLIVIPTLPWPVERGWRRLAVTVLVLLHVAGAFELHRVLSRAATDAQGLDGALAAIPPRKIVKSLIYSPSPRGFALDAFMHVASYYQARGLGEVDQSFAMLVVSPVHYRQPDRRYLSWHMEHIYPVTFDWRRAMLYDYILLYDRDSVHARHYRGVPFRRVYSRNSWTVLDVESYREARERGQRPRPGAGAGRN